MNRLHIFSFARIGRSFLFTLSKVVNQISTQAFDKAKENSMNAQKKYLSSLMLLFGVLLAACQPVHPVQPAAAATAPASEEAAPVAELTSEFELVQLIVDFPPGAWTPSHTHGGMLIVMPATAD
jgi:hypothetical protein